MNGPRATGSNHPPRSAPGGATFAAVLALAGATFAAALTLAGAASVAAHGDGVPPAPDPAGFVLGWSFDLTIWLPLAAAAAAYLWAVRRVDRRHPATPVPRDRPASFLLGLAAIAVALQSGIERWDTTLFSVHMVQHLILIFVAAPLLVLGAPITLTLRVATPGVRRRWILPILHSRVVRVVGHPLVAWLAFVAVMWGSHLSPLFDAALEDPIVHDLEHVLYLVTAVLFFWPVVGRDPGPYRMGHPVRLFYLFLQMPLNSFLGVVILFSTQPLYAHYAASGRTWGPTPLDDQQLAGAIMWGGGDAGFILAILLVIAAWMRFEEARTGRREAFEDARAARAVEAGHGAADGPPPPGAPGAEVRPGFPGRSAVTAVPAVTPVAEARPGVPGGPAVPAATTAAPGGAGRPTVPATGAVPQADGGIGAAR